MYKILYTADLHGNREFYTKLIKIANEKNAQAVIIGGDICPHAHMELKAAIDFQRKFLIEFLLPLFEKFNGDIFIIYGNDDLGANEDVLKNINRINKINKNIKKLNNINKINKKIEDNNIEINKNYKNLRYIHLKKDKINKFDIIGYSFVPQMPFLLKDWEKLDDKNSKPITDPSRDILTVAKPKGTIEEDFKKIEKLSDPKKTIYVIHTPPNNSKLDIVSRGEHVGSKTVRKFIEKHQPPLTLHGHIHESPEMSGSQMDKIGKTICINVGRDYQNKILRFAEIDLDDLEKIKFYAVK